MRTVIIYSMCLGPVCMAIIALIYIVYGLLYTIRCINIARRVTRRAR